MNTEKLTLALFISLFFFSFSCKKKNEQAESSRTSTLEISEIKILGVIHKQGVTYLQYGIHYVVEDSMAYYALTSDKFYLETLIGIDTVIIEKKLMGIQLIKPSPHTT